MSLIGTPPGPRCGEMSPLTERIRPSVILSDDQCRLARQFRRAGYEVDWIALHIGTTEEAILQALAPMRMPNVAASRSTLNVTTASHEFIMSQRLGGEPIWKTTGRLLTELAMLRAEVLTLRAMKSPGAP